MIAQHSEIRDGMRIDWKASTRECPELLVGVPQNRPPEVFGGKVTIHAGGAHPSHLLLPIVPGT